MYIYIYYVHNLSHYHSFRGFSDWLFVLSLGCETLAGNDLLAQNVRARQACRAHVPRNVASNAGLRYSILRYEGASQLYGDYDKPDKIR